MKVTRLKEINKSLIKFDSTIKEVVNNLNDSGLKIALVINDNKKLLGTIVDGDIRRGLLNGFGLDDKIERIIFKHPQVVKPNTSSFEAIEIMRINYLNHLPIVDENQIPIGLHTLDDVILDRSPQRKNKVVIMAGGFGKRMLPLTKNKPKALIEVLGKPMLEHVVLKAKKCGFENFIFSINYLGNMIEDYFSNGKKLGVNISYISEKKPLGTVGALFQLKNLNNETIIVTNCDIISDINYEDALNYHETNSADATMVVRRYETKNPFGVIETKDNDFISYYEKPTKSENINAGIYIFKSNVLKNLKEEYKDMPQFFEDLIKLGKKVKVYPIHEDWNDFGQNQNSLILK